MTEINFTMDDLINDLETISGDVGNMHQFISSMAYLHEDRHGNPDHDRMIASLLTIADELLEKLDKQAVESVCKAYCINKKIEPSFKTVVKEAAKCSK